MVFENPPNQATKASQQMQQQRSALFFHGPEVSAQHHSETGQMAWQARERVYHTSTTAVEGYLSAPMAAPPCHHCFVPKCVVAFPNGAERNPHVKLWGWGRWSEGGSGDVIHPGATKEAVQRHLAVSLSHVQVHSRWLKMRHAGRRIRGELWARRRQMRRG